MELQALRTEIDTIDCELVELFVKRMKVSAQVAEYKREHGLPVLDATREAALLARVADLAGEDLSDYSRALYETILSLSRDYQGKQLGTDASMERAQ